MFEKVGLNKREAKDMVEAFFEEIRNALERGDGVKLSGFGNFQLRDKPQRPGRNPKTGEEIPITARRVVTFHASQKLKSEVEAFYSGTQSWDITSEALPPILAKALLHHWRSERACGVKPHVLRYWEQEFTQLKPVKRRGNRRYYQHHEVLLVRRIRELLYNQGFTISGARKPPRRRRAGRTGRFRRSASPQALRVNSPASFRCFAFEGRAELGYTPRLVSGRSAAW